MKHVPVLSDCAQFFKDPAQQRGGRCSGRRGDLCISQLCPVLTRWEPVGSCGPTCNWGPQLVDADGTIFHIANEKCFACDQHTVGWLGGSHCVEAMDAPELLLLVDQLIMRIWYWIEEHVRGTSVAVSVCQSSHDTGIVVTTITNIISIYSYFIPHLYLF